jgi:hypothetical protein
VAEKGKLPTKSLVIGITCDKETKESGMRHVCVRRH